MRGFYETKKEPNEQARQMYEKAIELDPQYAAAYAGLGWTYLLDWFFQWNPDRAQTLERAFELAQRAVALDDSLPEAHRLLGRPICGKSSMSRPSPKQSGPSPSIPTMPTAIGIWGIF